ncbi:hypothetical protein DDB_G0281347 [Dictyostelium discoideum AX4]|nr:hypothetical protein DDB_G0281347 [Dictyostelium discoideum AX4]EAL66759.1 hypothetical protein DDB_G0281347 [Dictyostelium discoideum AX4]|eukprot:XP_640736.1 hypothetical protein DDB_G0281347 [Dictyostelium discoideum AX4]
MFIGRDGSKGHDEMVLMVKKVSMGVKFNSSPYDLMVEEIG